MNDNRDPDLISRPVPKGSRFSLLIKCDICREWADYGSELTNRTDGRILKLCPECSYKIIAIIPGQEPEMMTEWSD